jgi:signal transduction histidine kinase
MINTSQRSVIVAVTLVGVLISLAGSWWLWSTEQTDARNALETRTEVVVDSTEKALSDATLRLTAVAGLYQASEEVTQIEFRRFVRKLGLLPGMEAIGYMPVVMGRNRETYEEQMQSAIPGYRIYDIDESGNRVPAAERRVHVPLQWYEPIEAFDHVEGFDSASDERRRTTLELARVTRDMAVTPVLQLVSDEVTDGFVMYWPVTDAETEALVGYAAAAMKLSALMEGAVSRAFDQQLNWEVFDVTDRTAAPAPTPGTTEIQVGGRAWEIVITPDDASDMTPNLSPPLLLLAAGLLATAFIAGALHNQQEQRAARQEFERLREITQAKDQFLASVGHELRTPLTSVLGFAELLRADTSDLSEEERVAMISSVADEASDLASIVDDLLVAARSELDLLVVTEVPVSARAQVAQVLEANGRDGFETIQVLAEPGNPYRALGDPSRVRQVLRNLITNACRYGGDQVRVRLTSTDDRVSIVVADDGAGVPAEDSERIFVPYYRAHSNESQPAALGIGLSVARQLARLMNGDLSYRRENGWTVFEFQLPTTLTRRAGSTGNGADAERQPDHPPLRVS